MSQTLLNGPAPIPNWPAPLTLERTQAPQQQAPRQRATSAPASRPARRARAQRTSPMVPWISIVFSTIVLAGLMVMVVMQRAELVKYQYALVDLRQAKLATVKERAELHLQIQRLSALERVDGIAGKIGMVRPSQRLVLDMSDPMGHAVAVNNAKKMGSYALGGPSPRPAH